MNYEHTPTHDARAAIARELATYYAELSGTAAKPAPRFSLARVLREMGTEKGLQSGYEKEVAGSAALMAGEQHDGHRVHIPLQALAERTLTVASAPSAGYTVGTDNGEPVDVLRAWSVAARADVTVVSGLQGNLTLPRVTGASAAGWASTEESTYTESQPTVGVVTLTPRAAAVTVKFSRQWSLQAEAGERLLRRHLLGAVGELVDAAFFAGTGAGGAPRGLVNTSGINTASGTSLALAGLLEMRDECIAAGAVEENLQWVATSGVQRTLAARERNAGGGRNLWDDNGILGRPAHATKTAPASTLIAGDFSSAILGIWGPASVKLEINPYTTNFIGGIYEARVVLMCDVAVPRPEAFSVATSVT